MKLLKGKKKNKMTEEERDAKIKTDIAKMDQTCTENVRSLEAEKRKTFSLMMRARAQKLPDQESICRARMGVIMHQIKATQSMQIQIQLMQGTYNLAKITKTFVGAMSNLSEAIAEITGDIEVGKMAKKMYEAQDKAEKMMDKVTGAMDQADFFRVEQMENGKYSEFDGEIDAMIAASEASMGQIGDSARIR